MAEFWGWLVMPGGSAAWNMAVDEALWRNAAARARPLLRCYRWDKSSVSFGYFQKFPADLATRHPVVRRPTGGGIVYHGDGVDTTYTVIVPAGHALHAMRTEEAYRALHRTVAAALALPASLSALTATPRGQYECFQRPVAGDVVAGDGAKLAGGAQRRGKSGLLHQGSIAAHVAPEQLADGFQQVLGAEFFPSELTDAERTLAEKLVVEKYATDAWNRRIT